MNLELAKECIQKGEKVWVLPLIMRPGKQSVFISTKNAKKNCLEVAIQTCIVNVRVERVPFFRKESSYKKA